MICCQAKQLQPDICFSLASEWLSQKQMRRQTIVLFDASPSEKARGLVNTRPRALGR